MAKFIKPVRVGIEGVFYSLAHVPDLVRYGSKPLREIRAKIEGFCEEHCELELQA